MLTSSPPKNKTQGSSHMLRKVPTRSIAAKPNRVVLLPEPNLTELQQKTETENILWKNIY